MHKNLEYLKVDVLTAPQTMTSGFVDIGPELNVRGYDTLMLYLEIDINNSNDVTIKPLGKLVEAATAEYALPLQVVGTAETNVDMQVYEINYDADGYQCVKIDVKGVMVVQLQAKAGTVGQTGADIESAYAILVND